MNVIQHAKNELSQQDAELLEELRASTPDSVLQARAHARINVEAMVTVRHANMSQRALMQIQGYSADVSAGGCQLILPIPTFVGDIFWLSFDRNQLDLAPVYARCLRCREIRQETFEVGFTFFSPIDLRHMTAGAKDEQPLV
ncbi:MAG: PilZ domain-containing protein [Planctomycetota bacterium]